MLLQDSLGGESKALMFCNVAPVVQHAQDTLSSLAFASKVSNVVLKTPQRKFVEESEAKAGPDNGAVKAERRGLVAGKRVAGR